MAVYVDQLRDYGWRHGRSCHMIADSVEELIAFAEGIGLRAEWFQPRSSPHFDLTEQGRAAAIQKGAVDMDQREFVRKLREIRQRKTHLSPTSELDQDIINRGTTC